MANKTITHFFDSKNIHLNPRIILGIWENREVRHDHTFVISFLGAKNKDKEMRVHDELAEKGCRLIFVYSMVDLATVISRSRGIMIFHGAISPFKKQLVLLFMLYLFQRSILYRMILVAWGGGDFCLPRKGWGLVYSKILRCFNRIVTFSRVDYERCYSLYGDSAIQISYIRRADEFHDLDAPVVSEGKRILVSHSGWAHNEHVKSFELIKDNVGTNDEVICPLAYGDKEYIEGVIKEGVDTFGDRFFYFTELMDVEDYQRLLMTVDVYVTSADIQTGLFALKSCLSNGAKIYCGANLYKSMTECGFKVFSIEDLSCSKRGDFYSMSSEDVEINKSIYFKEFGDIEALKNKWNSIYDLA